jgi:hypothetical protein
LIDIAGILRRAFADWLRSSVADVLCIDRQRLFACSHLIVASMKARVAQQGYFGERIDLGGSASNEEDD